MVLGVAAIGILIALACYGLSNIAHERLRSFGGEGLRTC
jgi:hypothetical protein